MNTKLIRKQVLLDEASILELEALNKKKDFNFSEYLRILIKKDLTQIKLQNNSKKSKLLAKKGFLKTHSEGTEAENHNDIYKL